MFKVEPSLKLVTKCSVVGEDISEFVKKMNSSGYYTYVEDYFEDEELDSDHELDVIVFKVVTK